MKLTLDRTPLLAALARAHRVVERRNTIPILANLLLRTDGDSLIITATDLDIEITQAVAADITSRGNTTVPAHTLHDIVRKLPDGAQVTFEVVGDRGTLSVRAGRSRFTLQTLPDTEFPDLARVEGGHSLALTGATLVEAIDRTEFAISTEETRYYLNGIYLHAATTAAGAPALRLVATDGHRLAQCSLPMPEGGEGMPGVIVPRKAVKEIKSLAEAADKAEIALTVSQNRIAASFAGVSITSKLIDGTFPDYGRVIPSGNSKRVEIDAAELSKAVDRVSTVASERGRAVKFGFDDGKLLLSVTNPDAGEAHEEVECTYAADPIEIGFNARYVGDCLGSFGTTGPIEIRLADAGSPALITRPDQPDALCVLMPMRV